MANAIQFYDGKILFGDSAGENTDKIAFHEDCCCVFGDLVCQHCKGSGNNAPDDYEVVIAGLTDAAGCDDGIDFNCSPTMNGTFSLTFLDAGVNYCTWWYNPWHSPCGNCDNQWTLAWLRLRVAYDAELDESTLEVMWVGGFTLGCAGHVGGIPTWRNTYSGKASCLTWNDEPVELITSGACGGTPTCIVTAL